MAKDKEKRPSGSFKDTLEFVADLEKLGAVALTVKKKVAGFTVTSCGACVTKLKTLSEAVNPTSYPVEQAGGRLQQHWVVPVLVYQCHHPSVKRFSQRQL